MLVRAGLRPRVTVTVTVWERLPSASGSRVAGPCAELAVTGANPARCVRVSPLKKKKSCAQRAACRPRWAAHATGGAAAE